MFPNVRKNSKGLWKREREREKQLDSTQCLFKTTKKTQKKQKKTRRSDKMCQR